MIGWLKAAMLRQAYLVTMGENQTFAAVRTEVCSADKATFEPTSPNSFFPKGSLSSAPALSQARQNLLAQSVIWLLAFGLPTIILCVKPPA